MKKTLLVLLLLVLSTCGQKEQVVEQEVLPEITADTETTIEIWGWNVAAKALEDLVPRFNEKYPNIKVNVIEYGGPIVVTERATVVLNSGQGMPDILQVESDFVQTYAETYPHRFLDMKNYIDPNWGETMDPSKVPVSYDTEGRLVSIPWDSGPVVLYYKKDYFDKAGINPEDIKTWDDYIVAGKKITEVLPDVTMTGFGYTTDDGIWRIFMPQVGTYYLNTNDQITINSKATIKSAELLRRMRDEGIAKDLVNWSGLIQSLKNGSVATYFIGGWWSGTMKDQAPELAGEWRVMEIPSFTGSKVRASTHGGSTMMISASDPIRKAAALEFVKFALFDVDSQYQMFNNFGLFPSYIPTYSDPRFSQPDPYFGGQNANKILGDVVPNIPPVVYNSAQYGEIRNIAVSAFERILNSDEDITVILNETAQQIKTSTGKEIAK